jgi:hypothetical protein
MLEANHNNILVTGAKINKTPADVAGAPNLTKGHFRYLLDFAASTLALVSAMCCLILTLKSSSELPVVFLYSASLTVLASDKMYLSNKFMTLLF